MPIAELIDFTGAGHPRGWRRAAEILLFTKNTRLEMSPAFMTEITVMSEDKLLKELEYVSNTIESSWEFLDLTFLISDVTRAFTHQLVRTRNASFAQQTMRVLNVEGWGYAVGPTVSIDPDRLEKYEDCMVNIANTYDDLIKNGAEIEDARGVLPTNILTNIVMKMNFRSFCNLVRSRSSSRTQSEYRIVLDQMKDEVIGVWPFAHMFFSRTFDTSAAELEHQIMSLEGTNKEKKVQMIKLIDKMRGQSNG